MPFGLPEALHEVVNAKEGYVAATGTLTFDETQLPKVDMKRQNETPPTSRVKARMSGTSLGESGFSHRFDTPLSLEILCYGPWCAGALSGKTVLAFLKETPAGYTVTSTPCGGHIFYEPSKAILETVARCYLKGACPKLERN